MPWADGTPCGEGKSRLEILYLDGDKNVQASGVCEVSAFQRKLDLGSQSKVEPAVFAVFVVILVEFDK